MNRNLPVNSLRPPRTVDATGIYIHFPYCIQKCSYCDFYSIALLDRTHHNKQPSRDQLLQFKSAIELEFRARVSKFRRFSGVNTIYFGGGTASLMPPDLISDLIGMIRSEFDLIPFEDNAVEVPTEITLEGNPENFTPEYLIECQQAGINRINVGIQTFSSEFLAGMNRYFDEDRYNRIISDLITFAPPACG
ncbi:MAG: radical SAM protein, partial [Leptospiraceae bacterium]|nr:radical SAM protein [Leptospiraceae bacterium]